MRSALFLPIKLFFGIVAALLVIEIAMAEVAAQHYKPAVEYQSLMNVRYYENNGGFLVEDLQVVFPPQGAQKGSFIITKSTGEVVSTVPLRLKVMENPAFGVLQPDGVPGNAKVGATGDYVMAVKIGNDTITSLPFSLKQEVSADPFKPGSRFIREGQWKDFAYFSSAPEVQNGQVYFNFWMSLREMPGVKNAKVTIHLLANGQEIAASRGPVIPTLDDWQFFQHREMIMATVPKQKWLTLNDMTSKPGELTLIVKANGQPVKSYKVRAAGGQLQRLPQNSLTYEPHDSFISPRFIDMSRTSPSEGAMFDMYWVKRS
jgi:hypothetical protein